MSIFGESQPEKTDFERIGVNVIRPYKHDGNWVFNKNGGIWPMAPAGLTEFALGPVIVGADRLITAVCEMKRIERPEDGFCLLFSETYFPGCDVRLVYRDNKFDGWVYDIVAENLQGIPEDQQGWVCPYLGFYFEQPPQTLYVSVERHDGKTE